MNSIKFYMSNSLLNILKVVDKHIMISLHLIIIITIIIRDHHHRQSPKQIHLSPFIFEQIDQRMRLYYGRFVLLKYEMIQLFYINLCLLKKSIFFSVQFLNNKNAKKTTIGRFTYLEFMIITFLLRKGKNFFSE